MCMYNMIQKGQAPLFEQISLYAVFEGFLNVLVLILLGTIKRHATTEAERHNEYVASTDARHQENIERFDRIENGLLKRIERLENGLGSHVQWHLTKKEES